MAEKGLVEVKDDKEFRTAAAQTACSRMEEDESLVKIAINTF